MYCKKCGKEINDEAVVCPNCGCATDNYKTNTKSAAVIDENDAPSAGFAVLGFFVPLVGLILYLVWKDKMPLRAHSAGKGALISVIIGVVFSVIYAVIVAVAIGSYACTIGLNF